MSSIKDHVLLVKAKQTILPGASSNPDVPAHAHNHSQFGTDTVNVEGLEGVLADPQNAGSIDGVPVDTDGIVDGQALVYDETEAKMIPGDAGGESTFADLTDTDIDTPTEGQIPTYGNDGILRNEDPAPTTDAESIWMDDIEEAPDDVSALGPQLFANPNFDADTDWNKDTGWTIAAGVATKAAGLVGNLSQTSIGIVAGKVYQVSFDVTSYTAGSITPVAGSAQGTPVSAAGSYLENITAAGTDIAYMAADSTADLSIDNFKIREVLTIKDSGRTFGREWIENRLPYSQTLDNTESGGAWANVGVSANTGGVLSNEVDRDTGLRVPFHDIIGDVSSSHYIAPLPNMTLDAEPYTISCRVRGLAREWIRIGNITDNQYVNVNIVTGEIGTNNLDAVSIIHDGDDRIVRAQFTPPSSGEKVIRFYAADTATTTSYTGDGVTVDIQIATTQLHKGTLEKYYPYVKTTTAALPGEHQYRLNTQELSRNEDVVLDAPQDGDTLTYDAASGKWVNAAGGGGDDPTEGGTKFKNYSTDVYEVPVDGETYYANPGQGPAAEQQVYFHFWHNRGEQTSYNYGTSSMRPLGSTGYIWNGVQDEIYVVNVYYTSTYFALISYNKFNTEWRIKIGTGVNGWNFYNVFNYFIDASL